MGLDGDACMPAEQPVTGKALTWDKGEGKEEEEAEQDIVSKPCTSSAA